MTTPARQGRVAWVFLAIGAVSLLAQVSLVREVFTLTRGNALMLGAVLGGWLALTGGWAFVGGRLRPSWPRLGILFALAPLLFQGALRLLAVGRQGGLPGESLGLFREYSLALLAILPATALGGLAFGIAVGLQGASGFGKSFASENLGAALAGGLFHFLLADRCSNVSVLELSGAVLSLASIPMLWRHHRILAIALPVGMLAAGLSLGGEMETRLTGLVAPGERILATAASRYGRLVVVEREGRRAILQNGALIAATEDQSQAEEQVHLPLSLQENPRAILLIGGCVSSALVEVLRHGPTRVHCLEMDEAFARLARRFLAPEVVAAFSDPRVTWFTTDPRAHFRAFAGDFDTILLFSPVPRSPQVARLLTVETLRDARASLREGGIFAMVTPGRPAQLDPAMRYRHAMLLSTLRAVFPAVDFAPGEQSLFWASARPVPIEAGTLFHRLEARGVVPAYVGATWFEDRLLPFHREAYARALAATPVSPNHELRPGMYLAGMVEDLAPSFPWLAEVFCSGVDTRWLLLGLAGMPLLLGGVARLRRPRRSSPLLAASLVGASGMALSMLVFLWFQSIQGQLYHSLGGLLGLFMVGMVAGSVLGDRLACWERGLAWACAVHAAIAAGTLWALALVQAFPALALGISLALAGVVGVGTALLYAPAVEAVRSNGWKGEGAARIYAFDLLGASLAAVGACWVILPLLGFHLLALLSTLACAVAGMTNLAPRRPL